MLLNFSFRGRGLPSSPWAHAQLSPQNQHCSFGYRLSLPVAQMFLQAEDQKWERNAPFLRRLRSNGDAGHIKLSPCVGMRVVLNGSPGGCWRHWSWPDKWEIELQWVLRKIRRGYKSPSHTRRGSGPYPSLHFLPGKCRFSHWEKIEYFWGRSCPHRLKHMHLRMPKMQVSIQRNLFEIGVYNIPWAILPFHPSTKWSGTPLPRFMLPVLHLWRYQK